MEPTSDDAVLIAKLQLVSKMLSDVTDIINSAYGIGCYGEKLILRNANMDAIRIRHAIEELIHKVTAHDHTDNH